jgi:hypothetical protein
MPISACAELPKRLRWVMILRAKMPRWTIVLFDIGIGIGVAIVIADRYRYRPPFR